MCKALPQYVDCPLEGDSVFFIVPIWCITISRGCSCRGCMHSLPEKMILGRLGSLLMLLVFLVSLT